MNKRTTKNATDMSPLEASSPKEIVELMSHPMVLNSFWGDLFNVSEEKMDELINFVRDSLDKEKKEVKDNEGKFVLLGSDPFIVCAISSNEIQHIVSGAFLPKGLDVVDDFLSTEDGMKYMAPRKARKGVLLNKWRITKNHITMGDHEYALVEKINEKKDN